MYEKCFETKWIDLHLDGPVVPDEQVIKPISDSMSTTVGLVCLRRLTNILSLVVLKKSRIILEHLTYLN